jgi:GNAT superfamily N-acetyltransferase
VIEQIEGRETHDLRRRVLRDGRPDAEVVWAEDDWPGAFHLAVRPAPGEVPVAVATLFPDPTPLRPGREAWHLRGMAVEPGLQGQGHGRELIAAARHALVERGAEVLWANARDSALGFYQRLGFSVSGDGFLLRDQPHHVVVLDLS